jgi:hypothetical protein
VTSGAVTAALQLASAGVPIFPVWAPDENGGCSCGDLKCDHIGKHPLGRQGFAPNGFKSATTDPDAIRSWFQHFEPNIAVATGHSLPSGGYLVVVDVDPRHDGDKTLATLESAHDQLPTAATVETGGGGLHVYLTAHERLRCAELGPGVELKGVAGSAVTAPSLHASGDRYRWGEPFEPGVLQLVGPPAAPPWLVEAAQRTRSERTSLAGENATISNGGRNTNLTSLAGALRHAGAAQPVIEAALRGVNAEACEEPLPDAEVQGIARSVSRYEPASSGRRVVAKRASDICTELVRWAWQDRVPLGALTVLAGQQGLGKSTLCYGLAARATTGNLEGDLKGEPSSVVAVTLEDHLASVARPRLLAAKADLDLVEFATVQRPDDSEDLVTLPDDLLDIEKLIVQTGARLLVIDPIVATLNGRLDGHRDQDVRRALAPLHKLAERCDLAAVCVMHLNKGASSNLLNRVSGSIAWTAAARSVLAFDHDPEDPDGDEGLQRVLVHAKSNYGRFAPTLACRIEQRAGIDDRGDTFRSSMIVVTGTSSITATDLLARLPTSDRGSLADAEAFLLAELDDGPKLVNAIKRSARDAGVAWRTLERAKKRLGVNSIKSAASAWEWHLPEDRQRGDLADGGDAGLPVTTGDSGSAMSEDRPAHNVAVLPRNDHSRDSIYEPRDAA